MKLKEVRYSLSKTTTFEQIFSRRSSVNQPQSNPLLGYFTKRIDYEDWIIVSYRVRKRIISNNLSWKNHLALYTEKKLLFCQVFSKI
jgi:hypothetical protein